MNQINTGYQPQFALGALYQGENAADIEQSNQLELIKNALANLREQQSQPMDMRIKAMEAARADAMNTPEMLDAYQRGYIGQNNSQDAAGKLALGLLPFKQAAEEAQLNNSTAQSKLGFQFGQAGLDQYDQALSPQQRMAAAEKRAALQSTIGETPDHFAAMELQRLKNEGSLNTAEARDSNGSGLSPALKVYSEITKQLNVDKNNLTKLQTTYQNDVGMQEFLKKLGANKVTKDTATPEEKQKFQILEEMELLRQRITQQEQYANSLATGLGLPMNPIVQPTSQQPKVTKLD